MFLLLHLTEAHFNCIVIVTKLSFSILTLGMDILKKQRKKIVSNLHKL